MGFISNKEREERTSKLYRGNAFRKFFIIFSVVLTGVYVAYVAISVGITMGLDSNFASLNKLQKFFRLGMNTDDIENPYITKNTYVLFGITIAVAVLLLASIIIVCTMKSAKSISKEAVALVSITKGGRDQKNKSAAQKARERLGKE